MLSGLPDVVQALDTLRATIGLTQYAEYQAAVAGCGSRFLKWANIADDPFTLATGLVLAAAFLSPAGHESIRQTIADIDSYIEHGRRFSALSKADRRIAFTMYTARTAALENSLPDKSDRKKLQKKRSA